MGKRTNRQQATVKKEEPSHFASEPLAQTSATAASTARRPAKKLHKLETPDSKVEAASVSTSAAILQPVFSDVQYLSQVNKSEPTSSVYFQHSLLQQLMQTESPTLIVGQQMQPFLSVNQTPLRPTAEAAAGSAGRRARDSATGANGGGTEGREICSRRLVELNRAFSRLARLLPVQPAIKKLSKQEILHRAIHHIALLDFLIEQPF